MILRIISIQVHRDIERERVRACALCVGQTDIVIILSKFVTEKEKENKKKKTTAE